MLDVHDALPARPRGGRASWIASWRRCRAPRRWRSARARRRGLTPPELAVAAGVREDRRCTRSCSTPTCPRTPHLSEELDRYFPAPLPERFGDGMPRSPAAARDHRDAGDQQHAPRRRHDVRVPPARGERRAAHPRSRAPTPSRARSSGCARSGPRSRRSTARSTADVADATCSSQGRRLVERGSRWLLRTAAAAARHRARPCASSRPAREALDEALPRLLGRPTSSR